MHPSCQKACHVRRALLVGALVAGATSWGAWLLLTRGPAPKSAVELAAPRVKPQEPPQAADLKSAATEKSSFAPNDASAQTAAARAAMFHALVQIGGAEGLAGTLQTLQTTADPREIAVLAQNLEKLAPGLHRQEAIEASRDALAMAALGKLEGADVAPLFEV